MKHLLKVFISLLIFAGCEKSKSSSKEVSTTNNDKEAVNSVMKSYKDALENLSIDGTYDLFIKNSQVFESGGYEGSYADYIKNHIGPELAHFNSFEFSDYNIATFIDLPYAFTTESYTYTIDLKENKEKGTPALIIKKKGITTSVLRKINGKWKIFKTHSSSRDRKSESHSYAE